jgi:hypothetical protein
MDANTLRRQRIIRRGSACLTGIALSVSLGSAFAATRVSNPEIEARYQRERAVCLSGRSSQDQVTCLREAVNAREAALRGQLDEGNTQYQRNAQARCEVMTGDERLDCLARISEGRVSGSVEGGGILREYRKVVPAQ